ncbi:MAG TPA: tetratricopeptide repeat protein [Thermopetrobacter sp.]|nr:tetratricopeptide repeat protein [Thermopetrobacter sp.]
MLRIVFWFLVLFAMIAGLTWLADHPGQVTIEWLGWRVEDFPLALALGALVVVMFAIWLIFRVVRMIVAAPGAARDYFRLRRRRKGLESLSTGVVALLAGDTAQASSAARTAARLLPNEPAARLLEARAAQDAGDLLTARHMLLDMLKNPQTETAALQGLYAQAVKDGDEKAARGWAARAHGVNPRLPWAAKAMLTFKARDGDWPGVIEVLESMHANGLIDKRELRRRKAVALTAEARALEEKEPERAIALASRAHKLDPSLIPAADIAGGLLAAHGQLRKAAKIIRRTWQLAPHPDLAEIYAHLRAGDSPQDRLARLKGLLRKHPGGVEGALALARAAIEAKDWDEARAALKPYLNEAPDQRVYQLMAEIEHRQHDDKGRAREWLARALRAPRPPVWVAGDKVSPHWLPADPDSGELGVFTWKVPLSGHETAARLEPLPAELLQAPADDAGPMKIVHARAETAEKPAGDQPGAEEATPAATQSGQPAGTEQAEQPAAPRDSAANTTPPPPGTARKAPPRPLPKPPVEQAAKPAPPPPDAATPLKTARRASATTPPLPDDPGPPR